MVNLIKRDLIVQKWQLLFFIPFILVFVIADMPPVLTFLVSSIFIPFNTLTYDERADTDILLNSLPYTRKEIIASRYLGAIVYSALSIGLVSFLLFLFQRNFTVKDILIGVGMFLLFVAISFPIYFFVKHGNVTLFLLIGFLVIAWLSVPIVSFIMKHFPEFVNYVISLSEFHMFLLGFVIVVIFYILSWIITAFIYERKVF